MTESFVLDVVNVIAETADAHTIVFGLPEGAAEAFVYKPGQFLTVAIPSDQTGIAARCYSLSSSPLDDEPLAITVKRTVDGFASNWICDNLKAGSTLRVLPPSGIFTPKSLDVDLLLFAGGSGITPCMSIIRTALRHGSGDIVLFYANRDETSVIFAKDLAALQLEHPDRLTVVHWLESVQGLPNQEILSRFAARFMTYTSFVCGPAPFMKATTTALKELGIPREQRHQEKFVSLGGNPFGDVEEAAVATAEIAAHDDPAESPTDGIALAVGPVSLEVELDNEVSTYDDWNASTPMLDFLESKGLKAPFSCREGECSACAIRLIEGDVHMLHNDVLDADDLADGIRLGCQALPLTNVVKVSYH